jgi:hypothetical protein
MPKFLMQPTIGTEASTTRLGAGTGSANWLNDNDVDKAVKLVADSRYDLCAIGDPIEGFITSVDTAPSDGYSTGGIKTEDRMMVTAEGSQVAGTGALAIGDYVVAGTQPAPVNGVHSKVPATGPNVRKATFQPGVTAPAALTDVPVLQKNAMFAWRVVSLGSVGTGAVGTQVCIERVNM